MQRVIEMLEAAYQVAATAKNVDGMVHAANALFRVEQEKKYDPPVNSACQCGAGTALEHAP